MDQEHVLVHDLALDHHNDEAVLDDPRLDFVEVAADPHVHEDAERVENGHYVDAEGRELPQPKTEQDHDEQMEDECVQTK